ncbi:MAG: membrane protein insertion efficiency factor YidD [Planctomycetota bacterium]
MGAIRLRPVDAAGLVLIHAYRRWLSPRKGFACPHRLLHGGDSCSAYGLRVIRRAGVLRFRLLMQRRFAACRAAAKVIGRETKQQRRDRRNAFRDNTIDACAMSACDVPSCDLGPLDCGVADGAGVFDVGCGNFDCACDFG